MIKPLIYTLITALLLAGGVWWGVTYYNNTNTAVQNTNGQAVTNTNSVANVNTNNHGNVNSSVPEGWKEYVDSLNGFALWYPESWTVSMVSDQDSLNHQIGDVIVGNGSCVAGQVCNQPSQFCQFTIVKKAAVSDGAAYIRSKTSYLGSQISDLTLGNNSGLITDVAVTPRDDNGNQDSGQYMLLFSGEKMVESYLSYGYKLNSCVEGMKQILATLTFGS